MIELREGKGQQVGKSVVWLGDNSDVNVVAWLSCLSYQVYYGGEGVVFLF